MTKLGFKGLMPCTFAIGSLNIVVHYKWQLHIIVIATVVKMVKYSAQYTYVIGEALPVYDVAVNTFTRIKQRKMKNIYKISNADM